MDSNVIFFFVVGILILSLVGSCNSELLHKAQNEGCAAQNKQLIQDYNDRNKWFCGTYTK